MVLSYDKILIKLLIKKNITIGILGNGRPNFIKENGQRVLEEREHRSKIRDIDHLRERLIEEWNNFDHELKIIVNAIEQ